MELTLEDTKRIITNPFYAINIHESLFGEHQPLITEEQFVEASVKFIKENGAEEYVKNLLENLKGNFVK